MLESTLDICLQSLLVPTIGVDILLDRTELLLQFQELRRVMTGRSYFLLATNDSRIAHQGLHVFFVELRDLGKGELRESFLEIRPLVVDHSPVKTRGANAFCQSFT